MSNQSQITDLLSAKCMIFSLLYSQSLFKVSHFTESSKMDKADLECNFFHQCTAKLCGCYQHCVFFIAFTNIFKVRKPL